jgi:hypothetical protein
MRLSLLSLLLAPALGAQQPVPQPLPSDSAAVRDSLTAAFLQRTVTISGIVRDTLGRPLAGAEVRAGVEGASASAITRADGSFLLYGLAPDSAQLSVRRIGYQALDVPLDLEYKAGLRVELAIRLTPVTVTLGTVIVEGRRMNLELMKQGFYQRQKLGMGKLFDPEYLEHFGGTLPGLLHGVPGLTIERDRNRRAQAYGKFGATPCAMNVFLDGQFIPWATEVGIDEIAGARDILAVEVYPRPVEVPANFGGIRTSATARTAIQTTPGLNLRAAGASPDCGALLIWTKPFEKRRE